VGGRSFVWLVGCLCVVSGLLVCCRVVVVGGLGVACVGSLKTAQCVKSQCTCILAFERMVLCLQGCLLFGLGCFDTGSGQA